MSTKTYKPYKQDPHTFTPTLPIPRCPTDRAMSPPNPNCQAALQELMDHTFKRVLTRDRVPDDAGHAQGPAGTRRDRTRAAWPLTSWLLVVPVCGEDRMCLFISYSDLRFAWETARNTLHNL